MTRYYRAGNPDRNQAGIITALRKVGARVMIISGLGRNHPDLCVAYQGRVLLMEIKNPEWKRKTTHGQADWLKTWPGETAIVSSVDEALAVVLRGKPDTCA